MQPPMIKKVGGNLSLNEKQKEFISPIETIEKITKHDTEFPKGLHIKDHDQAVIKFFTKDIIFEHNNKKIPVLTYSRQRFFQIINENGSENKDIFSDIKLPLIALIRIPLSEKGSNFSKNTANIPNGRYAIKKINKKINGKNFIEHIKIPQPVNIDLKYELHVISNVIYDIDIISEKILFVFNENLKYINVNGHNIKLIIDKNDDESIKELKKRNYYYIKYNILLKGYILDECDFEKVRILNEINFDFNVCNTKINKKLCPITYNSSNCNNITFKSIFYRNIQESEIFHITNEINIFDSNYNNDYEIFVNNTKIEMPFTLTKNDKLKIKKINNLNKKTTYKIFGKII